MSYDLRLYEFLKNNITPCKLTIRQDETIIRCPFCGDSKTSLKDAHFYIHNSPPFAFYCQKCNVSSKAMSPDVLKKIGVFNPKINNLLSSSLAEYRIKLNTKYGNHFDNYFSSKEVVLRPKKFTNLENSKLAYIEKRLGIKLNEDDIDRYKIILNLYDFLEQNNINVERRNDKELEKIKQLNDHYVGFLCNDKNMITFRNMNSNEEERYYNFRIFKETAEFSKKFFVIKNTLDLSSRVFNIHLAEGIFDIIGVFNHIHNQEIKSNDLFIACNGKGYDFVLNYLKSIGILNCNIFIYSDKDVKLQKYKNMKKFNMLVSFNGINIYYNNIGKDFGVSKENIEISDKIIL